MLFTLFSSPSAPVVVKCSQTSKCHNTKLKDLSREDGEPLSKKDLTKGSNLILEMRGKSYAVQFMYKGKGKVQKGSRENDSKKTERKRQLEVEEDVGQLRDTTNVPEVLARAKAAKVAKVSGHRRSSSSVLKKVHGYFLIYCLSMIHRTNLNLLPRRQKWTVTPWILERRYN